MQKKYLLISLAILVISMAGCKQQSVPPDLAFELSDKYDEVNSADSTFKRRFIFRDSTIKIAFTDVEMLKIYGSMVQNHFFSLPDKIHVKDYCAVPYTTYYLTVTYNGNTKEVIFSASCRIIDENVTSFLNIRKTILDILETKPRYKQLPETNLIDL